MEKSDFDRLMERYLTGQVTDAERDKIEAWLDAEKFAGTGDRILTATDEDRLFRALTQRTVGRLAPRGVVWAWRMTAAFAALAACVVAYVWWPSTAATHKTILRDGTLVWARGASQLTDFRQEHQGRRASFQGEALFEVAKDAAHPFEVHCGPVRLRVMGTSFNLKTRADGVTLTVLTGTVNLSSTGDTTGVDVRADEAVMYNSGGRFEKQAVTTDMRNAMIQHTDYPMQFADATVDEVTGRLEKKFDVTVHVEDPMVRACRVTADFTDHSLSVTLQMIAEMLDLTVSQQGHVVTLRGAGCRKPVL